MFCDAVSPGPKRVPGKSRHKTNTGRKEGREGGVPGIKRGNEGERVREGARGEGQGGGGMMGEGWREDRRAGKGSRRGVGLLTLFCRSTAY